MLVGGRQAYFDAPTAKSWSISRPGSGGIRSIRTKLPRTARASYSTIRVTDIKKKQFTVDTLHTVEQFSNMRERMAQV